MRKNILLVLTIVSTLVLGTLIAVLPLGEVQAKPCTQGGVTNQPSLHNVPCNPASGGGIGIYSFVCGGCDLLGISLPGEDLSIAWLRMTDLSGANLEGANLSGAILLRAIMEAANLTGANLSNADLIAS